MTAGRGLRAVAATLAATALTLGLAAPVPAAAAPRVLDVTAPPYGAAGDGSSNDRAAIQGAIDDAAERGGGTVLLPAGRTFLTGNLRLRSEVTLDVQGTLKQSQSPGDYSYQPLLGHTVPGQSYGAFFVNDPFLYAGHAHDVAITGHGTILMTRAPGATESVAESHTIHVIPIGFFAVDGFRIADVDIEQANTYNVALWSSRHGVVTGTTIFATHENTDGINTKSSQHIRITGNTITNKDDGIIVGSGYDDPRDGTWWDSDTTTGGSSHIEIDHNTVRVIPLDPEHLAGEGAKAIAFIPWGTRAPDPRWTELRDISIHDNRLYARQAIGCWCDNPYAGSGKDMWDHSAITDVRIRDNEYRWFDGSANTQMTTIHWMRVSDLQDDFGKLGTPELLNGDFEHLGTTYWSTRGSASASDGTPPPAGHVDGPPPRDEFVHAVQDQARSWGWLGYAQGAGSRLYEGLGLNDGVPYRLTVDVRTGAVPARLYAENVCTGEVVGDRTVVAPTARTEQLDFRAAGTCSDYRIGVETSSGGWALIDNAAVATTAEIINDEDPRVAYTGSWTLLGDGSNSWDPYWGLIGGDWRWGTSRGATVTTTFTGTRAWLYAFRRMDAGTADIYLDGVHQRTVDLYHWAWTAQHVAYDTGPLAPGQHTLQLVTTGEHDPAATEFRTTFDAVLVDP